MTKREILEFELKSINIRIAEMNEEISNLRAKRDDLNASRLEIMRLLNEALQEELAEAQRLD